MKNYYILFSAVLFCTISFYAQQNVINDIATFKIKNSGTLMDSKNDVDGYYFFYEVDKLKKGKREYAIRLFDNNLNEIANKSYIDDKSVSLIGSKYNNQSLMFVMFNPKDKIYKLVEFDREGNEKSKTEIELTNKEFKYMEAMKMFDQISLLKTADNKGFLFSRMADNKKMGYEMQFVNTNGGKSWTFGSPKEAKAIFQINPIEVNEDVVVAIEMSKKSLLSKGIELKAIVLDTDTGEKLFEKIYEHDANPRMVTNAFMTPDDKLVLLGEYYAAGSTIIKSESDGMFAEIFDLNGKSVSDNLVSWENDIDKMMPKNEKGKDERGYIYFHDIIRTTKGTYFCIGERYRKTVNAGKIALSVLGGGYSGVTDLTITDIVFFEFDENFKLKDIRVFEKGKSKVGNLTDFGSPQLNAHHMSGLGAFDYEFTQRDEDRNRFYSTFIDYERLKGEKNKTAFKSVIYDDGEIKEDKIYLDDKKRGISLRVLPAKIGNVMLLEYNKKEKTIDMHMEKINVE